MESDHVDDLLARLPLRAKVAHLVFPPVMGDGSDLDKALECARAGVGGFVLYGGVSPRATAELLNTLRDASRKALPSDLSDADRDALRLMFSADQENGAGQVVKGATELPPQLAFAAAGCADLMREGGRMAGAEGRAMGFDLNYAPSADFTSTDTGPIEAGRTFGSDLALGRKLLAAYVEGYHEGGMGATAKHFPGRGSVTAGKDDPFWCWIDKSPERYEAEDLTRFADAIAAGVDFVMSEHIGVPSVTGDDLPASVNPGLVQKILREKLGFEGVITTDDLWYDKVCERFGAEEVALLSLEAGHDVLLKPKDPLATIDAVVAAVESGRLTEERIDASLARLLRFKARYVKHQSACPDRAAEFCGSAANVAVAQKVADAGTTVLVNRDGTLPLAAERLAGIGTVVHVSVARRTADTLPAEVEARVKETFAGKDVRCFTVCTDDDTDASVWGRAEEAAKSADLVLASFMVTRNRMGDPAPLGKAKEFLTALTESCDVIALTHGNPYLIPALPKLAAGLTSWGEGGWFGNRILSISSLLRVVTGDLKPTGKLPVEVGPYPIGHGLSW